MLGKIRIGVLVVAALAPSSGVPRATICPPDRQVLTDYLAAVSARTRTFLESLGPADLDRVVDRRWDPPVTLGVRLVSVADDCMQHVGQAAYVRGLLGY